MTDLSSIKSTDIFSESDFHEMVAIIRATKNADDVTANLKAFLAPFLEKINSFDGFDLTMDDFLDQVLMGIGTSMTMTLAGLKGNQALSIKIGDMFTEEEISRGMQIMTEHSLNEGVAMIHAIVQPKLDKLTVDHPDKTFHRALEMVTMRFVSHLANQMNGAVGQTVH